MTWLTINLNLNEIYNRCEDNESSQTHHKSFLLIIIFTVFDAIQQQQQETHVK